MTNPTAAPSPQQAALQQARDALTGWMDEPDTPAAYDASMERAVAAVAAIDAVLAPQAVSEPPAGVAAWDANCPRPGYCINPTKCERKKQCIEATKEGA